VKSTYPKSKFTVIQADVGQKAACEKLIAETISQLGGLDVIISNAGTSDLPHAYHRVDAVLSI
jgi:NADP-dependent 3-hydroxy acid dehydrogenase YdfG